MILDFSSPLSSNKLYQSKGFFDQRKTPIEEGKIKNNKFINKDFGFWRMQIDDYLYQKKVHQLLAKRSHILWNDRSGSSSIVKPLWGWPWWRTSPIVLSVERLLMVCWMHCWACTALNKTSNLTICEYYKYSASNKVYLIRQLVDRQLVNMRVKWAILLITSTSSIAYCLDCCMWTSFDDEM